MGLRSSDRSLKPLPPDPTRHQDSAIALSTSDDSTGEGFDQAGSIRRPKNCPQEVPWIKFEKAVIIETRRLDDWCADNDVKQVDFIWMDAQGAEGDVIAGGQNILQQTTFLYTEYSNNELYEGQLSFKKLVAQLPSFEIIARYPGDVLLKNKETLLMRTHQYE